jgi:tetratricopeptide (TPR) repeat protein
VALLINFVAAGGIGFGGVAQSRWLLFALALNQTDYDANRRLSRRTAVIAAGTGMVLLIAFTRLSYYPQLEKERLLAIGDDFAARGNRQSALVTYQQATEADRFAADAWERLANMALHVWLETGSAQVQETFRWSVRSWLDVNPRSHVAHARVGDWWLQAFRHTGERQNLDAAIEQYRVATQLYPHYNLGHAQLAWTLYLSGDESAAEREAAEALRLNGLNPHVEQNLASRKIYDPAGSQSNPPGPPNGVSAEQLMESLRSGLTD